MRANYLEAPKKAKISHKAMNSYLQRAAIEAHVDRRIREHQTDRMAELTAYAAAVDANWLYTLHTELHYGKKRLRRTWEAMVRNRIAFREFLRDGMDEYVEQPTGKNVEDEATIKALLELGVDVVAWEAEPIRYDRDTGEVTFG